MVLFFVSCVAPRAVIRMNQVSENVKWNCGQAFATDTVSGIKIEAAFDKSTIEFNIFDISVQNSSNLCHLLDTTNFIFEEIPYESLQGDKYSAIDPERMLLSIDKQLSKEEADSKNAAIGAAVFAGAIVAISSDVDHDHHQHYQHADPDLLLATPVILDAAGDNLPYDYVSKDDRLRNLWANETIRKTTLEPGYLIDGKVFFPRFEKPGAYLLKLAVDDQYIEIPFTQLNFIRSCG